MQILIHPEREVYVDFDTTGLTLTCVAFGPSLPSIVWRKNGVQLTNGSFNRVLIYDVTFEQRNHSFTQSILELCPVNIEDIGDYDCHASTSMNYSTIPFRLIRVGGIFCCS